MRYDRAVAKRKTLPRRPPASADGRQGKVTRRVIRVRQIVVCGPRVPRDA